MIASITWSTGGISVTEFTCHIPHRAVGKFEASEFGGFFLHLELQGQPFAINLMNKILT